MDIIQFNDIPGIGTTRGVGLEILALAVAIDLLRETLKLVRGVHADFIDVVIRAIAACVLIAAIPALSVTLSRGVTSLSNVLTDQSMGKIDQAFTGALTAFSCESPEQQAALAAAGVSDAQTPASDVPIVGEALNYFRTAANLLEFSFSPAGIVLLIARIAVYAVLILKFFVIDVLWPMMFSLTVYLGVIAIPVTFLKEMGGLAQYARRVVSVALWPVVFAFLMALITATFPKVLERVATGNVSMRCQFLMANAAAGGVPTPTGGGIVDAMKFVAICIGIGFMLLKTPAICAAMVGTGDPGHGLGGTVGGLFTGLAGSGGKAGATAVGGAVGGPAGAAKATSAGKG